MNKYGKKVLAILLGTAMCVSLAACGAKDEGKGGLGSLTIESSSGKEETGNDVGSLGGNGTGNAGGQNTPAPSEPAPNIPAPSEPAPSEPAPEPAGVNLVDYTCKLFSMKIPDGWNVSYEAFDAGGGMTRLAICVQDPSDPYNILFYVQAMEPYFTDVTSKRQLCAYLDDIYDYCPVLDTVSARGVLEQWASNYTVWDGTGCSRMVPFANYSIVQVIDEGMDSASTDTNVHSAVLAEVSIPGASSTYGLFFEDTLTATKYPYLNIPYYIGYNNMGFCVRADMYDTYFDALLTCKLSYDFTGFLNTYSADYVPGIDFTEEMEPGTLSGVVPE